MPVQNAEGNKSSHEKRDLHHAPISFPRILALYRLENGLGIVAKKAEEHVAQRMFGFAVMPMLVDRKPIDGVAVFVRPVRVSLVMLHVNAIVEGLAKADCDRLEKGKEAVEEWRTEIGVVNEIVGDAIDVPGNADGIKESEDKHHPERHAREKEEHPEEIGAVEKRGQNRNDVPPGKRENAGVGLESLGGDIVYGMHR